MKNLREFLENRERNIVVTYENIATYSIGKNISRDLLIHIKKSSIENLERVSHIEKNVLFLSTANRHFGAKMKNGYINVAQMLIGIELLDIRRIASKQNFFIYDYENDSIVSIYELCKNIPFNLIEDFDDYVLKLPYSIQAI